MKKSLLVLTVFLLIGALLPLTSCNIQGEHGIQGENGEDGREIAGVEIVDGELIVTYTDGTVFNAGSLSPNQGTEGLEYYLFPDGTYGVTLGTAKYLEEVIIPATYGGKEITRILNGAFSGAINLKSITIPDSITSIADRAFEGCTSITSITIPNSMKSIGWFAFDGCNGIKTVYYTGTEEEWAAINIDDWGNSYLTEAEIIYNYVPEE